MSIVLFDSELDGPTALSNIESRIFYVLPFASTCLLFKHVRTLLFLLYTLLTYLRTYLLTN